MRVDIVDSYLCVVGFKSDDEVEIMDALRENGVYGSRHEMDMDDTHVKSFLTNPNFDEEAEIGFHDQYHPMMNWPFYHNFQIRTDSSKDVLSVLNVAHKVYKVSQVGVLKSDIKPTGVYKIEDLIALFEYKAKTNTAN